MRRNSDYIYNHLCFCLYITNRALRGEYYNHWNLNEGHLLYLRLSDSKSELPNIET